MCYQIEIEPRDKLFFRDGRPMGGSQPGAGAEWPLPTIFHSAMLSAFQHRWPEPRQWEAVLTAGDEGRSMRFGSLKTWGPFPKVGDDIYVPTPADIEPSGSVMHPITAIGSSNLPQPLTKVVANTSGPTKDVLGPWMRLADVAAYLRGESVDPAQTKLSQDLFITEHAPGVGIDPETRANEDKQFYSTEYLRLREDQGVKMVAFAECISRTASGSEHDVLDEYFSHGQRSFIFGGQRGMAFLECRREKSRLPVGLPQIDGPCLKWVLLSPAQFKFGWLPAWIDEESGKVKSADTQAYCLFWLETGPTRG